MSWINELEEQQRLEESGAMWWQDADYQLYAKEKRCESFSANKDQRNGNDSERGQHAPNSDDFAHPHGEI